MFSDCAVTKDNMPVTKGNVQVTNSNGGFSLFSDCASNVQVDSCYSCTLPTRMKFMLDRHELGRLNDIDFNAAYCQALQKVIKDNGFRSVLDITQGFSTLTLQALKLGASEACSMETRPANQDLLRYLAASNQLAVDGVTFRGRNFEDWDSSWDVLVTELVESCGCLRQQVLEDIALAR